MSDKTVVIAEFKTGTEAQLALERLQAASIEGFVSGDTPNPVNFSVFGRMPYAPIQLHVRQSQAQRAAEILAVPVEEELDSNWELEAEAGGAWVCQLCDTLVEEEAPVCPSCGEPRQNTVA
ncbi:MAG TPA: hypothetical protein VG013_36005 [Gemmataceae bacterium]|jgi:hypothetical protein|nr:hypothetical protein [Gemmataceae bacterium]